jgi:hypothetical protein
MGMTYMRTMMLLGMGTAAAAAMDGFSDPRTSVPGFDAARVGMSQTSNMDLGVGNGEMDIMRFELGTFLCKPIMPAEGVYILPYFDYEMTALEFSGWSGPFQDEDLHSLGLSTYLVSMNEGSPWILGGWARAELATDFQDIGGDDYSFDLAAAVAYRFNEYFTLGFGACVTNLNGDENFYPGIGFDWVVNEQLRVGAYGPTISAAYSYDENWLFTMRFDFTGGVWNITDNLGDSRNIDLSDNRLGVYVSRRLVGELWLTGGVGMTIANELDYTTSSGTTLFSTDPETGVFGAIGLRLKAW